MDTQTKPWWQSKTLIGIAVMVAASLASKTGHTVSSDQQAAIVDAVATIAGAVGAMLATVGHVTSTKKPV